MPTLTSEMVLICILLTCSFALTVSMGWVRNLASMPAKEEPMLRARVRCLSSFDVIGLYLWYILKITGNITEYHSRSHYSWHPPHACPICPEKYVFSTQLATLEYFAPLPTQFNAIMGYTWFLFASSLDSLPKTSCSSLDPPINRSSRHPLEFILLLSIFIGDYACSDTTVQATTLSPSA